MKTLHTALAIAGLLCAGLAVASLSAPADTAAFNLLGGSLGQGQRDFRVFNNFSDPTANNNTTPHVNFPGALGASQRRFAVAETLAHAERLVVIGQALRRWDVAAVTYTAA